MNDITNMQLFINNNGGGGGGDIPEGHGYVKMGEELNFTNVTLVKVPITVRLEGGQGEWVDTYIIKPQEVVK